MPRETRAIRAFAIAVVVACLAPPPLIAQSHGTAQPDRPVRVSAATRAREPIRLDGKLGEADWTSAAATDSFTQIDPDEGRPGTQPTQVRVLYDNSYLYIGAHLARFRPCSRTRYTAAGDARSVTEPSTTR